MKWVIDFSLTTPQGFVLSIPACTIQVPFIKIIPILLQLDCSFFLWWGNLNHWEFLLETFVSSLHLMWNFYARKPSRSKSVHSKLKLMHFEKSMAWNYISPPRSAANLLCPLNWLQNSYIHVSQIVTTPTRRKWSVLFSCSGRIVIDWSRCLS